MSEPRNAERDLQMVESIDNLGRFNIFATHALPYWIRRAKNLKRALDRAENVLRLALTTISNTMPYQTDIDAVSYDWLIQGDAAVATIREIREVLEDDSDA